MEKEEGEKRVRRRRRRKRWEMRRSQPEDAGDSVGLEDTPRLPGAHQLQHLGEGGGREEEGRGGRRRRGQRRRGQRREKHLDALLGEIPGGAVHHVHHLQPGAHRLDGALEEEEEGGGGRRHLHRHDPPGALVVV